MSALQAVGALTGFFVVSTVGAARLHCSTVAAVHQVVRGFPATSGLELKGFTLLWDSALQLHQARARPIS
ncbi:hypothetical protein [Ottowia sp.]|uniref:hypothetical protein n=1 Tax=Ottowia sp. TaxID=1898956 RepID=UPI002D045A83|nr:hypothetical protein [Ottowia sp.]HRN76785.1 hypothetical protein [Ottowia sp.]HRQ03957.1 hypothetical protein [Ottowia sp.]